MAGQTRHQTPATHQSTLVQNTHCTTQQERQNQARCTDPTAAPPTRRLLEHRATGSSQAPHPDPHHAQAPPWLAGAHRDTHEATRSVHDRWLHHHPQRHRGIRQQRPAHADFHRRGIPDHSPTPTPTSTDLTCIDGRFLGFTIDTVEAPLSILAIYAPHNQREQQCRDKFWQTLTTQLSTHRERTPLPVVGDFNALALDELAAIPHATGPHFVSGKTAEEDEPDDTAESDTNQRQFHDLITGLTGLLHPTELDGKSTTKQTHTHTHTKDPMAMWCSWITP